MKTVKSESKLCLACMENHEVPTVQVTDTEIFKDTTVSFAATYEYCSRADQYLEDEEMIRANSLAMKDAYRQNAGMLTSREIQEIRQQYGVSQKDFSEILGWGQATITRYENHQVQDRAHDDILRKISADPKWFIEMLHRAQGRITSKASAKYLQAAQNQFSQHQPQYFKDSFYAAYANYTDKLLTGGIQLNLDKVVDMINYCACKTNNLYKVKLMKLLWYADTLHFKRHGKAISGLVYKSLPMGAVPLNHECILELVGVTFDYMEYAERQAYRIIPPQCFQADKLGKSEIEALNKVLEQLGHLTTTEIVDTMHKEEAYKQTLPNTIIPFSHAKSLSLD